MSESLKVFISAVSSQFKACRDNLASDLGSLMYTQSSWNEAEPLMRRALTIDDNNYGAEHPNVARDLNNLAQLLKDTNRLEE